MISTYTYTTITMAEATMPITQKSKLVEDIESRIFSEKTEHVSFYHHLCDAFSSTVEKSTSNLWYNSKIPVNKSLYSEKK